MVAIHILNMGRNSLPILRSSSMYPAVVCNSQQLVPRTRVCEVMDDLTNRDNRQGVSAVTRMQFNSQSIRLLICLLFLSITVLRNKSNQKSFGIFNGNFKAVVPGNRDNKGKKGLGEWHMAGAQSTGHMPHDYSCYCLPLTSTSTTAGSARVVVSPRSDISPAAIFFRILRIILPLRVLGRPSAH